MDTLLSMRVFRMVAAEQSFTAAARRLDLSPAMVTKHIAHLEAHLGARVLHRTTRRVSLTELGRQYLAHCADGLDLIDAAEASVSHAHGRPSGTLKVTAPVWFGTAHTARLLAAYQRQYPDVTLDIQLENRRVDLAGEGYDVALRATADPSPTMIVRPLTTVPFHLVAAPALFAGKPPPQDVAAAGRYGAILPSYVSLETVTLEGPAGRTQLKLQPVMLCNDTHLALQGVLAGMGMAFLPSWLVDTEVAAQRLIRVLPDHHFAPITLYAAYSSRRYMTSKVRTFIDFFGQSLNKAYQPQNN